MDADPAVTESTRGRRLDVAARVIAAAGGLLFVAFGLWAFAGPRSFFEAVAVFEPYNAHFIRDIGAFQVGLGAVLLLATWWRDALLVALSGVAAGAALHVASHVVDRDAGGDAATDIPFFAVLVLLLAGGAVARAVALSRRD